MNRKTCIVPNCERLGNFFFNLLGKDIYYCCNHYYLYDKLKREILKAKFSRKKINLRVLLYGKNRKERANIYHGLRCDGIDIPSDWMYKSTGEIINEVQSNGPKGSKGMYSTRSNI